MKSLKTFFERYLDEELTPRQKDEVDTWHKGDNSFSNHAFGHSEEQRSSVPLQHPAELSPHHDEIQRHFDQHGIKISDYVNNSATDKHGRTVKIGKALVKTGAPSELIKKFNEDSTRSRSKSGVDDYTVNISRHPHDVAGMTSAGHSWENQSCMNFSSGMQREYLPAEVQHGTHIAYLTHKDDKTNKNPVGRIALKKYTNINDPNDHILRPENRTYGDAPDAFTHTVNKWVNHHFPGKEDAIYRKHDQVYDDTGNDTVMGKKAIPEAIASHFSGLHARAATHPDLQPEHITSMLQADHIHARHVGYALSHPNATTENITQAMNHENEGVQISALRNRKANASHITQGLNSSSPHVQRAAIENKNATPEHIEKAMNSDKWTLRARAAAHKNATADQLTKALHDKHEDVRLAAISNEHNPNVNASHVGLGIHENQPSIVREFAAGHKAATPEHINTALNDGGEHLTSTNRRIRSYAASNPNASSENIHRAMDHDQHISIRSRGLHNPNATGEHVMKALSDPDVDMKVDAVRHKKVTAEHLDKAASDPSISVKYEVINHPLATKEHMKRAMEGAQNQTFLNHAQEKLRTRFGEG
jgi:hypothetical protein